MTSFRDLEPCRAFPVDCDTLVAVGWLGRESARETGSVPAEFLRKLSDRDASERGFRTWWDGLDLCQDLSSERSSGIAGNRRLSEERGAALGIGASEPAPVMVGLTDP